MFRLIYFVKIMLVSVGIAIIIRIIYLMQKNDDTISSDIEYINSLKNLPKHNSLILLIKKNEISETSYISKIEYTATINYKFDRLTQKEDTEYTLVRFDVIIYKNNRQITEHHANYYQKLYFSHGIEDKISNIDNFVKSSLNDIYQECMEYKIKYQ